MIAYIVRRLFSTIIVMAVVAFVVFSLLYLTPGDPAAVIAGDIATDEDIRRIHAKLGRAVMSFSVLGFSVPVFVFAYMLILTFSVQLDWLPVQGYRNFRDGVWEWLRHLILPSIALGTVYVALIARMTRASMLDVLA